MKNIKTILAAGLVLIGSAAHAYTVNFIDLANNAPGELGALSLSYDALTITATKSGNAANAYLDGKSGGYNAGLGVCGTITTSLQCNPSDDDNVTSGEFLTFSFSEDTWVNGLFVNTNHDPVRYFSGSQGVLLNGVHKDVTSYGSIVDFNKLKTDPFFVAAGTSFDLGFENKQFYVSAIDFVSVPEPATLGLLALGLAGIGAARRKQTAK